VPPADPTNATIADGSGLGTITDNDTSSITIAASTVTEGNSGTVNATFNVSLSTPSGGTVTIADNDNTLVTITQQLPEGVTRCDMVFEKQMSYADGRPVVRSMRCG